MPIYEYECAKCGHIMEAIQKISDASLDQGPVLLQPVGGAMGIRTLGGRRPHPSEHEQNTKQSLHRAPPSGMRRIAGGRLGRSTGVPKP